LRIRCCALRPALGKLGALLFDGLCQCRQNVACLLKVGPCRVLRSDLLQELIGQPFSRAYGAFRFSIMHQDNAAVIQARVVRLLLAALVSLPARTGCFFLLPRSVRRYTKGMTDAQLRDLERAAQSSGAPDDAGAWRAAQLRAGALSASQLSLLAYLGETLDEIQLLRDKVPLLLGRV